MQALCSFSPVSLFLSLFSSLVPSKSFYLPFPPLVRELAFSSPWKTSSPSPRTAQPGELLFILQKPAWAYPPGCLPDSSRLGFFLWVVVIRSLGTFLVQTFVGTDLREDLVGRRVGGLLALLPTKPILRRGPSISVVSGSPQWTVPIGDLKGLLRGYALHMDSTKDPQEG